MSGVEESGLEPVGSVAPVLAASVGHGSQLSYLSRLALAPPHANLLVGPPGSGLDDVARRFIAAVLCPDRGCGHCRTCTRVMSMAHPDVFEVEPEGASILVEQAREIVRRVNVAPIEAGRAVVLIHDIDRLNETAANKLLKTIEEPPPGTVIVGHTSSPQDVLITIRSRCVGSNLAPLTYQEISTALLDDGVDADAVADAVAASGGSLDRARRLAGPYRDLRRLALDLPARLRPYGASAGRLSAEITDAVDAAVDGLGEQHAGQIAKLRTDIEAAGYPPRVAATMERSLENRQKRLVTQARIEALGEVFAGVLASVSNRLANGEISPEIADGWFSSTEQTQRVFTETPSVRTSLMLDAWLLRCPPLG